MADVGKLTAKMEMDIRDFSLKVEEVRGSLKKIETASESTSQKMKLLSVMAGVQLVKDFGRAAGRLIDFGKEMMQVGIESEAAGARYRAVFGENTAALDTWVEENRTQFGQATDDMQGMVAGVANMLTPLGQTTEEAGRTATKILELGAAWSSYSGGAITAAAASEALVKGVMGQTRGLLELGMNAKMVQEIEQEMGPDTDNLAAALGRLEEITRQSGTAMRVHEEMMDGALGAQREMETAINEVKDALGEMVVKLAPAIRLAAGLVGQFADMLSMDVGGTVGEWKDEFAKLPAAIMAGGDQLAALRQRLIDMGASASELDPMIAKLQVELPAALGAVAAALDGVLPGWHEDLGGMGAGFDRVGNHVGLLETRLHELNAYRIHDKSFSVTMNTLPGISMTQFNPLYAAEQELLASSLASIGYTGMQRAAGGPVGVGQSAIVGEAGPELLTVGEDGAMVTPFSKLPKLAGGGKMSLAEPAKMSVLDGGPKMSLAAPAKMSLAAPATSSLYQQVFRNMGWMWTNWAGQQKQTARALEGLEDKMEAATATAAAGIAAPHMTDSGNTTNINVYVTVEGSIRSDRELAKVVESELVRAIRRGGASDVLT